jgi:hypothetical protein
MNKTLRRLITFLAAIVILVFTVGLILPKTVEIERSIEIEKPVDQIFTQVSNLKNMSTWSPWREYDPDMIITFEGEDGKVGSVYKWTGNNNVGSGDMKVTHIIENERVDLQLNFIEPYASTSNVYFTFADNLGNTLVTWGYHEKAPIPKNLMMVLFGVKKMLSKEFDKGLRNLKEVSMGV